MVRGTRCHCRGIRRRRRTLAHAARVLDHRDVGRELFRQSEPSSWFRAAKHRTYEPRVGHGKANTECPELRFHRLDVRGSFKQDHPSGIGPGRVTQRLQESLPPVIDFGLERVRAADRLEARAAPIAAANSKRRTVAYELLEPSPRLPDRHTQRGGDVVRRPSGTWRELGKHGTVRLGGHERDVLSRPVGESLAHSRNSKEVRNPPGATKLGSQNKSLIGAGQAESKRPKCGIEFPLSNGGEGPPAMRGFAELNRDGAGREHSPSVVA